MATDFDATDFVDSDFQSTVSRSHPAAPAPAAMPSPVSRPPTREELNAKVNDTQVKLAELKHAQEELERARTALEEARRRQAEFQNGRQEMTEQLTRGVTLMEEALFNTQREAEQMAKTMAGLREALDNVQSIRDESWTKENYATELTRALATIENSRMEWNSARLKWPVLSNSHANPESSPSTQPNSILDTITTLPLKQLARIGFALTWPIAAAILLTLFVLSIVLLVHK